jgi:hypothetical protein
LGALLTRTWFWILGFLAIALPNTLLAQNSLPKLWSGEIVEADQGLVCLYSMMIDSNVKHRNGDFSFVLKGRRNQISYSFSAKTQEPKLPPNTYWKIKEDTYDLVEASFIDDRGKKRVWKGPYPKALVVKPRSISSLGTWYLVYLKGDSQFNFLLKSVRLNLPIERWKGTVLSVFDGLSGETYNVYKGENAENGQGIRRVLRGVRSIQMLYRLDLFRFNVHAPEMSRVLQSNDADIRSCYTDLLDKDAAAKGELTYAFVYSGIAQGIKSLKIRQTNMNDPGFQECMYFKLRALTFSQTQSMAGELSFQFNTVE